MKKIICALMALTLFFGAPVLRVGASDECPDSSVKSILAEIQEKSNGRLVASYRFQYDAEGRLIEIERIRYPENAEQTLSVTEIRYDSEGRMLSNILENEWGYTTGAEYTYNEKGQLMSERHWEGGSVRDKHFYDSEGNRIKTESTADGSKDTVTYEYNSLGQLTVKTATRCFEGSNKSGVSTYTYTYDTQGRLSMETVSWLGGKLYYYEYDYAYGPFVVSHEVRDGKLRATQLLLNDEAGLPLFSMRLTGYELIAEEGRLVKATKDNTTYSFSYEKAKRLTGDITCDGVADYEDALFILRASIGLEILQEADLPCADVTGDGAANYEDALKILRASIGLETLE